MDEIKNKGLLNENIPVFVWVCNKCKCLVRSNCNKPIQYCTDCEDEIYSWLDFSDITSISQVTTVIESSLERMKTNDHN